MILLDTSTKLELKLNATPSTELDWLSVYIDTTNDVAKHNDGVSNGTTDVIMVAAPSADKRLVRYLNIYNKDSSPQTITIKIDDGVNERILIKQILEPESTLIYDSQAGWYTVPIYVDKKVTKTIVVEAPGVNDNKYIGFTHKPITVSEIRAVLVGSSNPSVTWTIRYGSDRSSGGTEIVVDGTTTTSTTTGSDVTSFTNDTIPADNHYWLVLTVVSGIVNELAVTPVFNYT